MIIFMNGRHTFVEADTEPIVWVDAQDATTYTLSGNDVLTLDNKGTLGGAMTLNGSVKFANSGFESWSSATSITKDLGETFLPTNSFTIVTTLDYAVKKSNNDAFSGIYSENSNRILNAFANGTVISPSAGLASNSSFSFNGDGFVNPTGVVTLICSYNYDTNELTSLAHLGSVLTQNIGVFNNTVNAKATILNALAFNLYSGVDNPIFEFRLYDRAFTLPEMQNLQTELNNKHIQLGSELIVNGDFSNGLTGWANFGGTAVIVSGKARLDSVAETNIFLGQQILTNGVNYQMTFEISNSTNLGVNKTYIQNNDGGVYYTIENEGLITFNFTHNIASPYILFRCINGGIFDVDNVSVKEIL